MRGICRILVFLISVGISGVFVSFDNFKQFKMGYFLLFSVVSTLIMAAKEIIRPVKDNTNRSFKNQYLPIQNSYIQFSCSNENKLQNCQCHFLLDPIPGCEEKQLKQRGNKYWHQSNQCIVKSIIYIMGCTQSCTGCKGCSCHQCKKCIKPPRPRKNSEHLEESKGTTKFVMGLKGRVKELVEDNDDFLSHHLQNEFALTKYASSHKIRARQIIEHYMFSDISHAKDTGSLSTSKLTELAMKAWFQRTFLEVLERGEQGFLVEKKKYNDIRQQVAEEYIFEIYQMGEFINAGFGHFSTKDWHLEIPLSLVLLNSDSALYALLGRLQKKYPLVEDVPNMEFPKVDSTKTNISLLSLINSRSYQDPDNLNRQSLMDDLKVLIDQANDFVADFKSDMQNLLGPETETDCKVKRQNRDGKIFYKAEAVRRVFIKWSETLIERIPEAYEYREFLDFVKSKKKMANEFIFKGTVSPTTHQHVIDSLSELLEALKYKKGTREKHPEFGLFIYDFLRCKTTRKTGDAVVDLLRKMQATTKTKSGKRFEVVRIKNRFKWATRDLLINFRYGQHLVGEAQLCVDVPHDSDDLARKIKFRHYLYELERGLFGPTFQMIMQYQDFTRKDIVVELQTEGLVKKRTSGPTSLSITAASRKCPQKHDMIAIQGDIFSEDKIGGFLDTQKETYVCDFCFSQFPLDKTYHYCYYCSIFYCTRCHQNYKTVDPQKISHNCMDHSMFKPIESLQQFEGECAKNKSIIVIFYREGASASKLFMDQIAYLFSAFKALGKPLTDIFTVNVGKKEFWPFLKTINIQRTPTTIIFNANKEAQVTLVGSTFHDIESLLKVRERIAKNLPKGLKMKCSVCHQMMVAENGSDKANGQCQVCMDTNKMDDLKDLVRLVWLDTNDFVCKNKHVRCAYCSYLSSDSPSYYRDYTGRTYLSNRFVTTPSQCFEGHEMETIPQPAEYKCSDCRRLFKGSSEETISYCKECNEYICIDCEEADTETLRQKWYRTLLHQIEVVTHFVQNRLEESYPCGCGKYFLKVYQSRRIESVQRMGTAVRELINEGAVRWKCRVCNKAENQLRVHLACFYCPIATELKAKPYHTEICIDCAVKSGLIGRQAKVKLYQIQTNFQCRKGHQIILTSSRQAKQLYFLCSSCKNLYYPYTQRYECRTCKFKICENCKDGGELVNTTVLTTSRKCPKDHQLTAVYNGPKLQFCSACLVYIREAHFSCKYCRYFLCVGCASNKDRPMINSRMNLIEESEEHMEVNLGVKKK